MKPNVFSCALLGLALTLPSLAGAQNNPKFEYAAPPEKEVADVEWKVSAQAGLLHATGNARATSMSSGLAASRKQGKNQLAFDAAGAYVRSSIFLGVDDNANGAIDPAELQRLTRTTSRAWAAKARYDRFLTDNNSLYFSGLVSGDEPAGKTFVGGGQFGYSRVLFKNDVHKVLGEGGYDFSYENLSGATSSLYIHSARVFAGYEAKLSEDTGLLAAAEVLLNINSFDMPQGHVSFAEDTRFNSQLALSTTVYEDINVRFGFVSKYDAQPAPRPALSIPYASGFTPIADRLDTRTEVAIIVNFL